MAQPFTNIPLLKKGFLSSLLKKPEPDLARCEVNNILASLQDVRELTKIKVLDVICGECHVKIDNISNVVDPLFRKMVFFVLEDAVLTPEEAQQVRHLKDVFGISDSKATSIIQTIGKSIYDIAKEEAESDGVISKEEKEKLANLKRQLGLQVNVPEVGRVWSKTHGEVISLLMKKINTLEQQKECLSTVYTDRPDIAFHIDFDFHIEHINDLLSSGQDLLVSLNGLRENDFEGLQETIDMEDEIDIDVINELNEVVKTAVELFQGPIIDPEKEKEKEQRKYERERKQNTTRAKRCGFDPKGSPKQRAWVFDIIGRDWFGTDFGKKCESLLISKDVSDVDDRDLLWWLETLKEKPCGWWIGKANDDMEEVYADSREKAKQKIFLKMQK